MTQRNEDGPKCLACGKYTERVGTHSMCSDQWCDRFCMSVNDKGLNDEEALADAVKPLVPEPQADGSEQAFREYLDAGPAHNEFGYARND